MWLVAAVVLGAGEVVTTSFYLAPFAGGALVAMVASLAGAPLVLSGVVFLAVSLALLATLRPIAQRHLRTPAKLRTGTAALVGKSATVVERVDGHGGCVKLEGEVWSAKAYLDDEVIEPGARVQVMEIRGATALVSE